MDTPDPTLVGNNFIIRYYTVLSRTPDQLHHFYSDRSARIFGNEDEEATSIKGAEEIKTHIESQKDFDQSQVSLSAVDCQGSANGGIFISVVGHVSKQDSNRKFSQTFFLENFDGKYYVLNDIFRYLNVEQGNERGNEEDEEEEEEEETATEATDVTPSTSVSSLLPSPPAAVIVPAVAPTPIPTPAPAAVAAPVTPAPAAQTTPTPVATPAPVASAPATSAAATSTPAAPVEAKEAAKTEQPVKSEPRKAQRQQQERKDSRTRVTAEHTETAKSEPKSGTWASIVKSDHEKTAAPVAQAQPQQAGGQAPQKSVPSAQAHGKEKEHKPVKPHSVMKQDCSLYVSGLTYNTTEEQLLTAFSTYGKVTEIVLKAGKGFAFIAFETPQTVQSALDAIPTKTLLLPGQSTPIVIEQRKPNKHNTPVTLPHHAATASSTSPSSISAAHPHSPHTPHTPHGGHSARGRGRGGHPRTGASPRVPRDSSFSTTAPSSSSSSSSPATSSSIPAPSSNQPQSGTPSPHYAPKKTNTNTNSNNTNYERRTPPSSEFSPSSQQSRRAPSSNQPRSSSKPNVNA